MHQHRPLHPRKRLHPNTETKRLIPPQFRHSIDQDRIVSLQHQPLVKSSLRQPRIQSHLAIFCDRPFVLQHLLCNIIKRVSNLRLRPFHHRRWSLLKPADQPVPTRFLRQHPRWLRRLQPLFKSPSRQAPFPLHPLFQRRHLNLQLSHPLLLLRPMQQDRRRRHPARINRKQSQLIDVVEKSRQPIVVPHRHRIILVIVTARALHRQS